MVNFTNIFELYQVFMHNLLCQNIRIFRDYILLTKKIGTFWSGSISSIRSISTFWVQKVRQNSQRLLNYIKSSCVMFCVKLLWYSKKKKRKEKKIDAFWSVAIRTFLSKTLKKIHKDFFNFIVSLCINFCAKTALILTKLVKII